LLVISTPQATQRFQRQPGSEFRNMAQASSGRCTYAGVVAATAQQAAVPYRPASILTQLHEREMMLAEKQTDAGGDNCNPDRWRAPI
jgi:hypothetical protein